MVRGFATISSGLEPLCSFLPSHSFARSIVIVTLPRRSATIVRMRRKSNFTHFTEYVKTPAPPRARRCYSHYHIHIIHLRLVVSYSQAADRSPTKAASNQLHNIVNHLIIEICQ